jgi:hypothetical protein
MRNHLKLKTMSLSMRSPRSPTALPWNTRRHLKLEDEAHPRLGERKPIFYMSGGKLMKLLVKAKVGTVLSMEIILDTPCERRSGSFDILKRWIPC